MKIVTKLLKNKTEYPAHPLTPQEAEKFIKSYNFWYQRIYLGNGLYTIQDGKALHEMVWERLDKVVPENLKKASVLDFGSNAGFFCLEMKKRNAGRVVGIECFDRALNQANELKKIYGFDIDYVKLDAHDVKQLNQSFDIVVFTGVLYHLKNPLQVLEAAGEMCNDAIIVETEAIVNNGQNKVFARHGYPATLQENTKGFMKFVEANDLNNDGTNWWIPDEECVKGMLRTAGFKYFSEAIYINETRLVLVASKEKQSILRLGNLKQSSE